MTKRDIGIPLTGFFDAIETDDSIVEYKTSAQTLGSDDIGSRPQFTAYSYAFEILYHKPPDTDQSRELRKSEESRK
jgi:RecB family exonuclease